MREDLRLGGGFPDLELPDHTGNRRRVRLQDEAEVAYTRFASVSVDPPEVAAAFRAGLAARWTFLSDAGRRYLDELDLLESTDTVQRPYLPASFLLLPDLSIHQVWNGYWFWGRPTHQELRQGLRAVTRAICPDWEVPRPVSWCWLAWLPDPPTPTGDEPAAAQAGAWVLDPTGPPAWVSLVPVPPQIAPLFDDPGGVAGAAAGAGRPAVCRGVHPGARRGAFADAVTVEHGEGPARLADDPFACRRLVCKHHVRRPSASWGSLAGMDTGDR
jgi:hypothetical protein